MALDNRKKFKDFNLNLVPMIDVTSFILLALAILTMSMKKEASLDNILKLPPVVHASKQDKTLLQIYVLPATILPGGNVNPDSTGLIAFMGKAQIPARCPNCKLPLRDAKGGYIPGSLTDMRGKPMQTIQSNVGVSSPEEAKLKTERPPSYLCSRCKFEISPYLKLDEIPKALSEKKREVLDQMVATENFSRTRKQQPHLTPAEIKKLEEAIPLMVKADNNAFYGRILQVVDMAQDKLCDIKKFTFVTLPEASAQAQKKDIMKGKK